MPNEIFRVVVAGGGSGGHVYPTLAVVDELVKRCRELSAPLEITRMGPQDGYDVLFENRGVRLAPVVSGKVRSYFSLMNIIDVPKFLIGFLQSLWRLYFMMPDVIFSKGGTGAPPTESHRKKKLISGKI